MKCFDYSTVPCYHCSYQQCEPEGKISYACYYAFEVLTIATICQKHMDEYKDKFEACTTKINWYDTYDEAFACATKIDILE